MKLGLHISDFTWDGGAPELRVKLGQIAQRAEEAGVDRISVMDHVWQIGHIGPPEHEMLEAYTALGWLAAKTERVKLLAMVTAVVYREPGLLAKAVTTLDVLSGGRAILGIGAAWNADESAGLGLFFPPVSERFERLEEAILICKQMWSGDEGPFDGKHYHLGRTLNSPQALSRPHPPILIGGVGREEDAQARRPLRRRVQHRRLRPRRRRRTSLTCSASTASTRAATTTRSRRPPRPGTTWARTARTSTRRSSTCTRSPSSASARCTARCSGQQARPARPPRRAGHPGRREVLAEAAR